MTRFRRIGRAEFFAFRVALLAIIAIAIAGALSLGVSTAKADLSMCPAGNYCVWSSPNYSGSFDHFNERDNGSNQWFTAGSGNIWESLYNNRTNKTLIGDYFLNGVSPPLHAQDCVNPGSRRADLHNWYYPPSFTEPEVNNIHLARLVDPGTSC